MGQKLAIKNKKMTNKLKDKFMQSVEAKIAVLENKVNSQQCETNTLKVDIMDRMDRGFNDMAEKIDHMIESQNGKNKMLDDRITKEAERLSKLEEKFHDAKESLMTELSNMKTKQAVSGVKLGALIIILSSITTMVASSLLGEIIKLAK